MAFEPNLELEKWKARWYGDLWALVPLRLIVGFGFAFHGYAKLARGPENFARILDAIGIPAPVPMAWLTTLLELLGGASLMLGVFVVPLSIPLGIVMLTALFSVHFRYGFSSVGLKAFSAAGAVFAPVGYEINLLYIAALLALALSERRKRAGPSGRGPAL
jgi:putative oxidoreductase